MGGGHFLTMFACFLELVLLVMRFKLLWLQICPHVSHSRVFCTVQGLAADVGCAVTLGDPK